LAQTERHALSTRACSVSKGSIAYNVSSRVHLLPRESARFDRRLRSAAAALEERVQGPEEPDDVLNVLDRICDSVAYADCHFLGGVHV